MLSFRVLAAIVMLVAAASSFNAPYAGMLQKTLPVRSVKDNVLTSSEFPNIQVRLDKAFRYVGKFDFTLEDIAKGERHVFVDSQGGNVKRMFIFQFEEILPESKETYNYSFRDALTLGGHKFRHGTYAYSNKEARRNNPKKEAALTADFLEKKGYIIDDEYMMSRFVTVPDAERKHELILFYLENVRSTGHRLEEFYKDGEETPVWRELTPSLTKRSFENFTVLK